MYSLRYTGTVFSKETKISTSSSGEASPLIIRVSPISGFSGLSFQPVTFAAAGEVAALKNRVGIMNK
ncbi:hypothetical protein [Methanosarcina sp. WWM596]|uniref:hypothetical protein n=1 Tax=Methanosarcina sp. WWM596 TaxID=1434103 RepID=UPI0006161885|nr:hypothetical protein [Methanosarcina sp. WWM596]AKB18803.1 hypothetical protein MSWHS_1940 [Methanosarcina sp. WWM596]AKB23296.1 hypothetical protein MSWH1_3025 [Methanosarcina sp. WH1]